MSTGDDDLSSGINGRLRPRKSYVSSPQTPKTTRKVDSKPSQEKPKRVSTQPRNPLTKSDDLSKKSDVSSVLEYLCPYCDKIFVSKQTASKHARRIHFVTSKQDDKGVINCLYCNYSEREPNDIFKHMIDSHPNQYFACLDCHTRFPSTKELAEHKLNVCERQKLHYKSKLPQKSNRAIKKSHKLDRQVVIREEERHGYNSIVISCELKPTHVTDAADIEDNITTNLILPSINKGNKIIDKNAVILLDDLQWKKRIPQNFSFHNTDTDQILSRLGVVHRSPRTGESTRKDWFKAIDDATQKFERCFDTNFYSKVASNVQENLSKFLDGSFNFNPDPNHTIKTRKAKNSVPINTVEGFPILLSCEQYSRNIFDGYMPRAIAPKHKWKWDNLENDRNTFNPDQIKRDSHVNNCIVTLVSSLDIWTQLCMRHKFEEKFKTIPFEKKTEKKKIISSELKEILESRQLPPSTAQVSRSCTALVKVPENLDFATSLGLTPSSTKYDIQPAVLSGEWVRPRCYVCCACGAQTRDPRALSTHILTEHPNAQVQHYEIPGELLVNADILKHLYVPPSPVQNRTRLPRGFRECTKCNKSITIEDLHQHMLDCAGDMPTVRRKCRYRHFGVRKRRPRIQDSRLRKKLRKDIHRQNGRPRPKIRTEVGDAETIRKMLADLPAKRHRVIVTPIGSGLRPKRKINPHVDQLTLNKRHTEDNKNRKFITDSNTSSDLYENGEQTYSNNPLKENKTKNVRKRITRRSALILNSSAKRTARKGINLRQDFNKIEASGNQLSLSPDIASSADSKTQVLSLGYQPNRVNVNSGPYNTREQANRSNNNGSNNRENQNPDRNDNNGHFREQGAPPQNIPLKHSIARLTADSNTHDKAVQFHNLFLVQQECNNAPQHVPSGQPVLFEDKAVTVKLDKPPLETLQKDSEHNSHKNKLNKQRKGLNDCIAMLRNKLVPNKAPDVSIQCKMDEADPPNSEQKIIIANRIDITVQCPDDNQTTETLATSFTNAVSERIMENPPLQRESTKHITDLVTTHKVSLSIEDPSTSVGISDTSENCERNNYSLAFKKGLPPKTGDSQSSINVSQNVQNQLNVIDNYQSSLQSVTPNCQDVNVTAQENENNSTIKNNKDRSMRQDLKSRRQEGIDEFQKMNESNNKLYIPEIIPPAHCVVEVESSPTAPLDLSGKLYVNEVIAHCPKQGIPYSSSALHYETLDLSNKGKYKDFQQDNRNELPINEVVVDLRVKHPIPTTSKNTCSSNYAEDIRDDMTATDLSLRHAEFPTDLSVKGKLKTVFFNEIAHKDFNASDIQPNSSFTCSQNDSIGLNLSVNEFPTDLSRKSLSVSPIAVTGQGAKNTISASDNDTINTADISSRRNVKKNTGTSGKNIISRQTPLEYKANVNPYKIQSRRITIPSEIHTEDVRFSVNEFHQFQKNQHSSAEVLDKCVSVIALDKDPINLSNPLKEVLNTEILAKTVHLASQQSQTTNLKMALPRSSVTPNYSNTTESQQSVTQRVTEKQNASDLPLPSKSRLSQGHHTIRYYELNEINACVTDQDPETAKKIALLPKELVEILGNMPIDHRNQLLNVLPQYVSTSAAPNRHDVKLPTHGHSQQGNEINDTEISQYSYSGMPKSHQQPIGERYQHPANIYYQPQAPTKKSDNECVQFPASLEEANSSCLTAGDNKRRSIDLSMCGIIDLTDETTDINSSATSAEKENKTESLALKPLGFKTNNEKTASLRAVRIKAPSERQKSIISEMQLKKSIPEIIYSNSHSDNGNNDINRKVQKLDTNISEDPKTRNVTAVTVVMDSNFCEKNAIPLALNPSVLIDVHEEVSKENMTISSVCNAPEDKESLHSDSYSKDKVINSETSSLVHQNAIVESHDLHIKSPEIEKIHGHFEEEDSEDDVSLAVIVKQKQRKSLLDESTGKEIINAMDIRSDLIVNSSHYNKEITQNKTIMHLGVNTGSKHELVMSEDQLRNYNNTQNDNSKSDGPVLKASVNSHHNETSCELSATPVEVSYQSEKETEECSRVKVLKYISIDSDKTVKSNKDASNLVNKNYSKVSQTSLTDEDFSTLSSNNNNICSKMEVIVSKNTLSTKQFDSFDSEKEKKENFVKNPYSKNVESVKTTENVKLSGLEKDKLVTSLRRSRRGKSLFVENSDDSCNFQPNCDAAEQRAPFTKKQLIFSKLLQDEENTVAKIPHSENVVKDDGTNSSSDLQQCFDGEFLNYHEKSHKRKHSAHKRKKVTKLKVHGANSVTLMNKTTPSVIDKDEDCKFPNDENNLDSEKLGLRCNTSDIDVPFAQEDKITGKVNSSSSSNNEVVLTAGEKKLRTIIDNDNICDNSDKNLNSTINAVRRCRSKSVFGKSSSSEKYDPYDFIQKVQDNDPILKRQSENRLTNRKSVRKPCNNDGNEVNAAEYSISCSKSIPYIQEKPKQDSLATRPADESKVIVSVSYESSKTDERMKILEGKKRKKPRKSQEISDEDTSETSHKALSVTSEPHDIINTENGDNTDVADEKQAGSSGSKKYNLRLQNENTNGTSNDFKTPFSVHNVEEVQEHDINSDCVAEDYDQIYPVQEVDWTMIKGQKITGKRKSNSCENNHSVSAALTKKIKSIRSDRTNEDPNSDHCDSEKSIFDPYEFDLLHTTTEKNSHLKRESEKRKPTRNILSQDDEIKPIVSINSPMPSNKINSMEHDFQRNQNQEDLTRQVSEMKVLFSDSDESSKSDEPLTKYIEEREKKQSETKRRDINKKQPCETLTKMDHKHVSLSLEQHDINNPELKNVNIDELDKEKHKKSSTSSNVELDFLVELLCKSDKSDNLLNAPQKKEKQNKMKPLADDLNCENENSKEFSKEDRKPEASLSILDACKVTCDRDPDCNDVGFYHKGRDKDVTTENKQKSTGKRKSTSCNSKELVLSVETKKLKSVTGIDATSGSKDIFRNAHSHEVNPNASVRRRRSKSVLTESSGETCDSYDFELLHKVKEEDPILRRESIKRLPNRQETNTSSKRDDEIKVTELCVPSTSILYKSTEDDVLKTIREQGVRPRKISEAKIFLSDSDESSKSDEPLQKSAEKKKRKKSQSKHQERSHKEPCEKSLETDEKTSSVTFEKHENNHLSTDEEKHDLSSTYSNFEYDCQTELLYKRKEKQKKSKPRVPMRNENTEARYNVESSLSILDNCKVECDKNSDCDRVGLHQIRSIKDVDVPIEKISELDDGSKLTCTKSNDTSEEISYHNIQKFDNNNSDDILNETENSAHNFSTPVSLKHGKKPVMRRCRSKSLLVKTSSCAYDPYDINLLDDTTAVTEAEPFLKRESLINSSMLKKRSKIYVEKEALIKTDEFNSSSSNNSNKYIENKDTNKRIPEKRSPPKDIPCDSDESSKSDEPLTKYIEEREKKKSEIVEEPHKTLRKRKKKTVSVTLEKPDPDTSHDDSEERIRSEQFMESFGFFSERKPRKSNLLATKKISETYNLINSFYESEDKSHKKNLHCDSRKTADDEGNLKESFNTSNKKISRRGRKKKVSTKIEPSYCEVCRKEFRRPDNYLRHQLSLAHVSRVSEVELKVKNIPTNEDPNYLVIYKQQLDRFRVLQDTINRRKKYCKSLENIALPTLEDIIADVTRMVRQQQLAHRGLSRDEALFLDCCELLNASHNDDGSGRAKESSDCKINCYTCVQTSADCLNSLEKRINDTLEGKSDDGDVDSITAQDILESEEVRNLENDLITGLKEAAACGSHFKAKPLTTYTPEVGVVSQQVDTSEHSKDIDIINNQSDETKTKKAYEVKEKMYPDIIEDIDMFEDKFDKIKRKCRSQAAKQTQYVETNISSKSRKKVEKKKRKKSPKKNSSHGSVPTKGALKGFEGVKVSILTSEINMSSILPPSSTPPKKKKRSNTKRKKDRKHSESRKYDSDHSKDTHKKVDVYEFMDSEEAELFEFRPSTLMERFKSINKDIPSTSKTKPINVDTEITTESLSDGDDFVYMSDDYICSDAETENSSSCELGNTKNSSEVKKTICTPKRKDTTEKSAVMGKIFKHNAVRAEKKVARIKEPMKAKANLDQLFDSLLEEPNSPMRCKISSSPKKEDTYNFESSLSHDSDISKGSSKSAKKYLHVDHNDSDSESSRKLERSVSPEPYTSVISQSKRRESFNSPLKEKEFSPEKEDEYAIDCIPTTSKIDDNKFSFKHTSRKNKEASYEKVDDKSFEHETKRRNMISPNYDDDSLLRVDESSPDDTDTLSYSKRKSKEKEFRIKPSVLDVDKNNSYSFDDIDESVSTLDDSGVARQRARRKCTVGKQNVLAETWSSESEPDGNPPRPNSADSVAGGMSRKKKHRKKESHALGGRKIGNRQCITKRQTDYSTPSSRNSSESISRVVPTTRPSAVCPSSSKTRIRPSPYYWSEEEEPEHVQQHGWIVGDSHKKLVTMLAHAKGKRNNDDKRNLVE